MSTCPNCSAELEENAKFCMECGTPIPQNKKCIKCGIELPLKAKFCFGCGAPQDGSTPVSSGVNMGDKNVIAGDVVGQKIAGDNVQSKVMGNLVNNVFQDETKKVISCHICGKHLTNDNAHTCPKCGEIVCEEHFNQRHNCCHNCFKIGRKKFIVDISGNGDFSSISEAIEAAQDGATIIVKSGTYREHLVIDKKIILQGDADQDKTPIIWDDSSIYNSIIKITAEAELVNLKIMGQQNFFSNEEKNQLLIAIRPNNETTAAEFWPKCIHIKSSCKLNGVEAYYSAGYGIAIAEGPLSVSLKKCKIHDNVRAGLYSNAESGPATKIDIDMCSFFTNSKGLIFNDTVASFLNSSVYENTCGICGHSCKVSIMASEFYSNKETALYANGNSNISLGGSFFGATKSLLESNDFSESDFPSKWHNGIGLEIESSSKLSADGCSFFDSISVENCEEVDLKSSIFAVIHNQENSNHGIFFKGKCNKVVVNDCTLGLVHNDSDNDKLGQSGIGIICHFDTNCTSAILEISNTEFDSLSSAIFLRNEGLARISKCSFESIKWTFMTDGQSKFIVDSCKAINSLWAASEDLPKITFENMERKSITVARDGTGEFESIQDALNYAEDESVILVKCGAYDASFAINKPVTIVGEQANNERTGIVWELEKSNVGIEINAKATLKNLVVICTSDVKHDALNSDNNQYYAAVYITDDATLENVTVERSIDDGIIISGDGVKPTIKQCDICGNQGCGITQNNACANIIQCNIYDNNQSGVLEIGTACGSYSDCNIHENNDQGITLKDHTSGSFINCKIHDNRKNGIWILGDGTPKIEKCKIFDNKTEDECYPGIVVDGNAAPTILKSEIRGHLSSGIWCREQSKGTYSDCNIHDNDGEGAKIQDHTSGSFINCKTHDNKKNGFFIIGDATPKIEKCKVYSNKTENEYYPGIVMGGNSNPIIAKCEIFGHLSSGIWCQKQAQGTYSECDIHDNEGSGIKIQDSASGTFLNCKIHDNKGAGIKTEGEASPSIIECKVFSNSPNIDDQSGKADIDLETLFSEDEV